MGIFWFFKIHSHKFYNDEKWMAEYIIFEIFIEILTVLVRYLDQDIVNVLS